MSDPFFGPAFIDIDEWRDTPERHRYVHGGFEGTDTRFSFYLPPPQRYGGRFLQTLEGGSGGHENTAAGPFGSWGGIGFAFSCGAYLVESNQGHIAEDPSSLAMVEPTVHAYRASAQSARYAHEVAAEMYGRGPEHGYVYGGSGGAARCILCIENCGDVWDGGVPFMTGHGTTITLGFGTQAFASHLLGDKFDAVIDAVEPGGSGNPYAGLDTQQRDALAAMYRAGFPRGAEVSFWTSGYVGMAHAIAGRLPEVDPTYVHDFWTVPGYMGADGELDRHVVDAKTTVSRVVTAQDLLATLGPDSRKPFSLLFHPAAPDTPLGIVAPDIDPAQLPGASVTIISGAAAGRRLRCTGVAGGVALGTGVSADGTSVVHFEDVVPGDEIAIDNREYLAAAAYHRYQVETDAPEYHQFSVDGTPLYPQRSTLMSQATSFSGDRATGRLQGKMILVQHAMDAACWPNAAHSYSQDVRTQMGSRVDDQFRLWYTDHAAHIPASMLPPGPPPVLPTHLIDYGGCLEQALVDLVAWVEQSHEPPASTGYTIDADQHLRLATSAAERSGIQPLVKATVNGGPRADVAAGEPVTFTAAIEVPPGAGTVIAVEWDFEASGTWSHQHEVDGSASALRLTATHSYPIPGTYFPAARVTSHRQGDVKATNARVINLGRARVVVT